MTHLTRDELRRFYERGAASDRDTVIGHLAACESCRRDYVELVRLAPAAATPGELDPARFVARGRAAYASANPSLRRWRPLWIGLPLAAAATLVVMLSLPRTTPVPDEPIAVRGSEVQALAPTGEVASLTEFTWSSPFTASRYRVSVRDAAGTVAFTGETTSERLSVSAEQAARLGGPHTWTVEALDATGRVIAASRPRSFALRR